MLLIQIIIIAFSVFAISRTYVRFRSGGLSGRALLLWLLFWMIVVLAVALPQATSWLASLVGVGRGVDVAIYVSIVVLFYLMFRIFLRLERIERDITLLVREISLKKGGEDSEQH